MAQVRIELVSDSAGIVARRPALQALVDASADTNVFYEPWMLLPAMEAMQPEGMVMVLIWQIGGPLIGFFPLVLDRMTGGLPRLQMWRHRYCFLNTPLVSKAHGQEAVRAFMDWVDSGKAPASYFDLQGIAADSEFARLLGDELRHRRRWSHFSVSYERAMYLPNLKAKPGGSNKHQKEMRRLERRLADRGRVEYVAMANGNASTEWIDRFLALEASGWKGREGSAIATNDQSRAFFMSAASEALRCGRLQMLALELDGVPIAMKCNFLAGTGAFAFKIAYDERYAEFSPGVLLELFNMRHLAAACPQVEWMDSCARADHPMITRLWADRRPIASSYLLASRSPLSRAWVLYKAGRRAVGDILRRRLDGKSHAH